MGTFLVVGSSVSIINYLRYHQKTESNQLANIEPKPIIQDTFSSSQQIQGVSTIEEGNDAREQIVSSFLERHSSPLEPFDYFGKYLVEIADQYGIDYRLLPAIAMQESNLCKKIPEGSFNCLGFGVHSKGTLAFESYEANFERAAKELKKNYIDIGLTTPEKIMTKYTPHSNGSWANSVNQWIAEMEYNSREKGRTQKTDADLQEYISTNSPQETFPN